MSLAWHKWWSGRHHDAPPSMRYPLRVMVVWRGDAWIVKRQFMSRAIRRFDTKDAAVAYGRQYAVRKKAELFVFTRRGTMQYMRRYT